MIIIGVDPGSTTGLAVLTLVDGRYWCEQVLQVPAGDVPKVFEDLFSWDIDSTTRIATEAFMIRGRAARSRTPKGGEHARRINGWIHGTFPDRMVTSRSASQVKKWATDRRLAAAGILEQTKGMSHARDAQRHALFAARMDLQWPDPLSVTYPKDKISS